MSTITKLSMTIAALALSAATVPTLAQPTEPVRNIVLVHGAFADGSSWAKVIAILQAKGYNVTAVQNPLTSLADDVAATNRALALQKGPVILVGHSWAGAVITEAGVDPKVAGLVYVAAFAPDADEVIGDLDGSPFEERVERKAPHERAVHEEEIVTGHEAWPRIPEGPAHSARRPPT